MIHGRTLNVTHRMSLKSRLARWLKYLIDFGGLDCAKLESFVYVAYHSPSFIGFPDN